MTARLRRRSSLVQSRGDEIAVHRLHPEAVKEAPTKGTAEAVFLFRPTPRATQKAPDQHSCCSGAIRVAVSTSAPGGTRTPNLLIRRHGNAVYGDKSGSPVTPDPHVSGLLRLRRWAESHRNRGGLHTRRTHAQPPSGVGHGLNGAPSSAGHAGHPSPCASQKKTDSASCTARPIALAAAPVFREAASALTSQRFP